MLLDLEYDAGIVWEVKKLDESFADPFHGTSDDREWSNIFKHYSVEWCLALLLQDVILRIVCIYLRLNVSSSILTNKI